MNHDRQYQLTIGSNVNKFAHERPAASCEITGETFGTKCVGVDVSSFSVENEIRTSITYTNGSNRGIALLPSE